MDSLGYISKLLICPLCKASLKVETERLICTGCGKGYVIKYGIPIMLGTEQREDKLKFYESNEYIEHCKNSALQLKDKRSEMIKNWVDLQKLENVVELGCGVGILQDIHPNYIGLDISVNALRKLKKNAICCDVQKIPLKDSSVSMVVSFTTLEHTENPEQVLEECDRILHRGGVMLLADAWNCKPWVATGITKIPWQKCSLGQKVYKLIVYIKGSLLFRGMYMVPRRIFWELQHFVRPSKKRRLFFKRLKPNYEKFITSDSDATSSIESHSVLMWLKSRGYELLNAKSFFKRIFFRGTDYIVARKK